LSSNREPIILRTLRTSVVTCVSVYLGMPLRGPKAKTFRAGARNGLRLTVTNNTRLLRGTVSATQETATPLPAPRLRPKYRYTVNHT
jgi:hypothetical protein